MSVRREEGGHVELTVRDDGIGIAADMLPHIFELFMQVDHTSTKAQGGLGIGLTLAKNLVEMHGGTLEARSAGLGEGCEFIVRLALLVGAQTRIDRRTSTRSIRTALAAAGHRLLIVDDNEDAAESLAELLRLQGSRSPRRSRRGRPPWRSRGLTCRAWSFSTSGCQAWMASRSRAGCASCRVLKARVLAALTGWGQHEDRRRTQQAGFDHHFVKPPEPETLETLLNAL